MEQLSLTQKQYITEIAAIHESEIESQNDNYKKSRMSVALREEMIMSGLKFNTDRIWIEKEQETIIGYIWGRYLKEDNKIVIELLYVAKNYRKRGVATQLKYKVEEWGQTIGAQKIESTVTKNNIQMQQLNLKMDYQVSKVIMTKNLNVNNEEID